MAKQFIKGSFFNAESMSKVKKDLNLKIETKDYISQGYTPTTKNYNGVLAEIKGMPIAYCDIPTLNNVIFESALWSSLLENPDITVRMRESRSMLGEAFHADSMEVFYPNAANRITDFWLGQNNLVLGNVEILDTPNGNIIYSIARGGDIGISSRGWGDLIASGDSRYSDRDVKIVSKEQYVHCCWDFVSVPAVPHAVTRIMESLKQSKTYDSVLDYLRTNLASLDDNGRELEKIMSATTSGKIYSYDTGGVMGPPEDEEGSDGKPTDATDGSTESSEGSVTAAKKPSKAEKKEAPKATEKKPAKGAVKSAEAETPTPPVIETTKETVKKKLPPKQLEGRHISFAVFRAGKLIDIVHFNVPGITPNEVKESLIEHDQYPEDITVEEKPMYQNSSKAVTSAEDDDYEDEDAAFGDDTPGDTEPEIEENSDEEMSEEDSGEIDDFEAESGTVEADELRQEFSDMVIDSLKTQEGVEFGEPAEVEEDALREAYPEEGEPENKFSIGGYRFLIEEGYVIQLDVSEEEGIFADSSIIADIYDQSEGDVTAAVEFILDSAGGSFVGDDEDLEDTDFDFPEDDEDYDEDAVDYDAEAEEDYENEE